MPDASTAQLQIWLGLWNKGDRAARDELLRHTCQRLRVLTQRMLQDYQRVKQFEQTDDVLQTALLRLSRSMEDVRPPTVQDYFRLAGAQIRRTLIDMARHYFGPEGLGKNWQPTGEAPPAGRGETPPAYEGEHTTYEPGHLADWSEFHRHVEDLPADEREVFNLLWYQDLSQVKAADVLGISLSTVKRRWLSARLLLQKKLQEHMPLLDAGA
jgi:RNA polymerase sigma-70 factor (ECF subfamily)